MTKFLLPALFVIFTVSAQAQTHDSTAIKAVIQDFFEVFSEFDAKYMERTVTQGFELYDVGLVWNADSVRAYITKNTKPFKRENKLDFLKFNVRGTGNGAVAWVSYWNTGIFHRPDGKKQDIRWLESAIVEKVNGAWKIAQLHSTRVFDK
ncbi:MAG: nuclear transport factor 2 family protein [Candidatus Kapabacteria bacterium]|jgi:ketosteroid isomerase-like protein|nr:nuclear transport factor 2 family protein [Candidatus Kapabacteria bacterium]